jgi:transposase
MGLLIMFERIKTIRGRKYRYLVENVRDGQKVKQKVVKYLGPVDPIYDKNRGKSVKLRRTNASIYVRSLEKDEIKVLEKATKSSDAFKCGRAKILMLSFQGYFARQVAEKVGCEARKVRNAIKAFNKKGLKALERGKARGVKPKFTSDQRAEMLMVVCTEPNRLNLHFSTWSLPKLKRYFIEKKIVDSISIESIRQLLRSEGIKIKKSKRRQYSNDPDFAKKNF